jgi:salicylate hydroxylase
LNGEDVRDRWHNALKNLDDDVEINPDDVEIKVRLFKPAVSVEADPSF